MARKTVYFNEYNVRMGNATYLPLVSGILRAYAETNPRIRTHYSFAPFIFDLDAADNILAEYDAAPDVAAFSIAMWNEQLSLHVANELKRRWPKCLIVFGGAQLPHRPQAYFERYSFIDVGVRAEGEEAFYGILDRFIESRDFSGIPNVSYRDPETGAFVRNEDKPQFIRDLDAYPSPYMEGLYDYLFDARPGLEFQAIIETNRGCPFLCTFCYWGRGGTTRKYRYHGLDRVAAEIDWAGRNRIRYMFNADSNFGMHKRDPEIAEFLIETKRKYGFPEKFRTCWGKNTDKTVFHIANRLHAHGLEKGITLARQSNSKTVLGNVKRGNIKLETYSNLHRLFNARNIPVYTEMILGLPGETYESWRDGLEQLLKAGLKNQLLIYQCEVYPNTEFGDPDYQKKFGIRTQRIELREIHGSVRSEGWIPEFQDIVVETDSMPVADWRRMTRLSIMTMALCSMKLGHCILAYLVDRFGVGYMDFIEYLCDRGGPEGGRIFRDEVEFYDRYLDTLLSGGGRGVELPEFGAFYWDIEEASFLRCATQFDDFYAQFLEVVCHFISERGIQFDSQEIGEVVRYQRLSMPNVDVGTATKTEFAFNIPEYFARRFGTDPISVERDRQTLSLRPRDFNGDLQGFAREIILWGRKSDKIQVESQWSSVDRPLVNSQSESRQASKFAVDGLPRAANLGAL